MALSCHCTTEESGLREYVATVSLRGMYAYGCRPYRKNLHPPPNIFIGPSKTSVEFSSAFEVSLKKLLASSASYGCICTSIFMGTIQCVNYFSL